MAPSIHRKGNQAVRHMTQLSRHDERNQAVTHDDATHKPSHMNDATHKLSHTNDATHKAVALKVTQLLTRSPRIWYRSFTYSLARSECGDVISKPVIASI
ncbi:hypothetical protein TNCV_1830391 [Trichonephila clavipes]|nr:hypothetical protein TNCV_1830391 [Trichonephila clavipes]